MRFYYTPSPPSPSFPLCRLSPIEGDCLLSIGFFFSPPKEALVQFLFFPSLPFFFLHLVFYFFRLFSKRSSTAQLVVKASFLCSSFSPGFWRRLSSLLHLTHSRRLRHDSPSLIWPMVLRVQMDFLHLLLVLRLFHSGPFPAGRSLFLVPWQCCVCDPLLGVTSSRSTFLSRIFASPC